MDGFGWLEHDYPNLRDFFVGKLGVKESINVDAYVDRWLTLQDTNDQLTVETFLKRGFSELRFGHEKLGATSFKDDCMLWSLDKNWHTTDSIFLNDSSQLFNLFKDDFYFAWTPKNLSHAQLERFFTWLGVEPISANVSFAISENETAKKTEENSYFNEHSLELIARLVSSGDKEDRGDFEALVRSCLLYTSPSPRDQRGSRMPSSA